MASRSLILSASHDKTLKLWTECGGLVGVFGHHGWVLDERDTWIDPVGQKSASLDLSSTKNGSYIEHSELDSESKKTDQGSSASNCSNAHNTPGCNQQSGRAAVDNVNEAAAAYCAVNTEVSLNAHPRAI